MCAHWPYRRSTEAEFPLIGRQIECVVQTDRRGGDQKPAAVNAVVIKMMTSSRQRTTSGERARRRSLSRRRVLGAFHRHGGGDEGCRRGRLGRWCARQGTGGVGGDLAHKKHFIPDHLLHSSHSSPPRLPPRPQPPLSAYISPSHTPIAMKHKPKHGTRPPEEQSENDEGTPIVRSVHNCHLLTCPFPCTQSPAITTTMMSKELIVHGRSPENRKSRVSAPFSFDRCNVD